MTIGNQIPPHVAFIHRLVAAIRQQRVSCKWACDIIVFSLDTPFLFHSTSQRTWSYLQIRPQKQSCHMSIRKKE
jgi:hypothetical protein